jgi:hypothetical protein
MAGITKQASVINETLKMPLTLSKLKYPPLIIIIFNKEAF